MSVHQAPRRGLVLSGVLMELAGSADPGVVTLTIDATGLRVERPDGHAAKVSWPSVAHARCGEPGVLLDGSAGVSITAVVAGRLVRWVVPEAQMPPERATAVSMLLDVCMGAARSDRRSDRLPDGAVADGVVPDGAVADGDVLHEAGSHGSTDLGTDPPDAGEEIAAGLGPDAAQGATARRSWSIASVPQPAPPDGDRGLEEAADTAPVPEPAPEPPAAPTPTTDRLQEEPPSEAPVPALAALPRMRPVGGWERDVADVPSEQRRRRRLLRSLWMAVGVLVVAAAVVLVVGLTRPVPAHRAARPSPTATLARAVGLHRQDFPAGWQRAVTQTGPLSALLAVGTGTGLTPGTPPAHGLSRAFASCVGRRSASNVLVGPAGAPPAVRRTSAIYSGPPTKGATGAASVTSVYASAAEVHAAAEELSAPRFDRCVGGTVGRALLRSAESLPADAGATFGALTVLPLSLPERAGVRAAGVALSVPVAFGGGQSSVEVSFVFVAGGRVEETLVSYAAGVPFPPSVTRTVTAAIERKIASQAPRA